MDGPELGRVAPGMPVAITWDALQGRRWGGSVERMPTEVTALGSRQVGEVLCVIENPGGELLPGTNVNAEIRSREAAGALSIPREALRREGGETGVFLLQGDRVVWRKVAIGISSITRIQVTEGLAEGDAVALPTDAPPPGRRRARAPCVPVGARRRAAAPIRRPPAFRSRQQPMDKSRQYVILDRV